MKVKRWMKVTYVEDAFNIRVDDDFYNEKRDSEKEIDYVMVQENGVVVINTKKLKKIAD